MKKQKLKLLFIFLTITLFALTFSVTSSRYIGQIKSQANDVVAIPIIDITNPTFEYSLTDLIPGSVKETDFYVRNYNSTNINEVLMNI